MSNSFPSMISNEPPPLDLSSDDDDSEEFRTPGLKLDLSADPSPLSTPRKSAKVEPHMTSQLAYLQPLPIHVTPDEHSLTNGHDLHCDSSISNNSPEQSPTKDKECHSQPDSPPMVVVSPELDSPLSTDVNRSSSDSPQDSEEFIDCFQQIQTDNLPLSQSPPSKADSSELIEAEETLKIEDNSRKNINDNVNLESQDFDCALNEDKVNCDDSKGLWSEISSENLQNTQNSSFPVDMTISSDNQSKEVTIPKLPTETFRQISSPIDLSADDDEVLNNECREIISQTIQLSSYNTDVVGKQTTPTESLHVDPEDLDEAFDEFQDANSDVPVPTTNSQSKEELVDGEANFSERDDFGDFEAFQSSSGTGYDTTSVVTQESDDSNEMKTSYIGPMQDEVHYDDDDEFGDFSSTSASTAWSSAQRIDAKETISNTNVRQQGTVDEEKEDFADFQNFEEPNPPIPSAVISRRVSYSMSITPRSSIDSSTNLESKFENLVKTVIPRITETSSCSETMEDSNSNSFRNIEKELSESKDSHWAHVQDFEESKGLVFKWPNSHCQQKLYNSLNIDTTTIVYTERWGAIEVPRFAASMVEAALLQPEVCPSSMKSNETQEFVSKAGVPSTEDTQNPYGKRPLSKEAQQILQQIPDLSFMRSKTLVFPQAAASKNSLL